MEQGEKAARAYKRARNNLLGMTILTVANMVLMLIDSSISFSFSASTPQIVLAFSVFVYENLLGGIIVSGIIIGLFLLCWYMSKKNSGWLIAALVMFSIDTLILLLFVLDMADTSFLFEIAFHAWVLYYLITGVNAGAKLKQLPLVYEPEMVEAEFSVGTGETENLYTPSLPLRIADNSGRRSKILIQTQYEGMEIMVRRSYGLTELIIDGNVYAERKGVMEMPYILQATVKGIVFKTEFATGAIPAQTLYAGNTLLGKKNRLF